MLLPVRDLWMKKKLRIPGLPGLFIAGHGLFYGIGLHIHKNSEYSQDFGKHGSMQQCDCWDPQDPLNPKMIRYYVPCSGKFSWELKTRKTHTHTPHAMLLQDTLLLSPLGFIYRTFEECLEFIDHNEDNRILKFQSGLLLGLYSCIAVW